MSLLTIAGLFIQLLVLTIFIRKLGRQCIASVGFLMMLVTFFYHGLTEFMQAAFPGLNVYRDMTEQVYLDYFILLVSVGMLFFTLCYFTRRPAQISPRRLDEVIGSLSTSFLLKWPVLIGVALPSFLLIALRDQNEAINYWAGGLSDQFTAILLVVGFSTVCIRLRGRNFFFMICGFAVLLITAGSRTLIVIATATAISVLSRCGVRVPLRSIATGGLAVGLCFGILSTTRGSYGRFTSGESFVARLDAIATSTGTSGDAESKDAILSDTVYRFDGNSYGAMILQKQMQGFGITGVEQLVSTVEYMIPSFLFPQKLALDLEMRNEEAYADSFYQLSEDVDYISDLWSLLLGYAGSAGLLICFALSGFIFAALDNRLTTKSSSYYYLAGVFLTLLPLNMEQGVSGIIYLARAFTAIAALEWLLCLLAAREPRPGQRLIDRRQAV